MNQNDIKEELEKYTYDALRRFFNSKFEQKCPTTKKDLIDCLVANYAQQTMAWLQSSGKPVLSRTEVNSGRIAALLLFLLIGFVVVRNEPFRDPNIVVFLRILASLFAGITAGIFSGFLDFRLFLTNRFDIRASAGAAAFAIVFALTPTVLRDTNQVGPEHDVKELVHDLARVDRDWQAIRGGKEMNLLQGTKQESSRIAKTLELIRDQSLRIPLQLNKRKAIGHANLITADLQIVEAELQLNKNLSIVVDNVRPLIEDAIKQFDLAIKLADEGPDQEKDPSESKKFRDYIVVNKIKQRTLRDKATCLGLLAKSSGDYAPACAVLKDLKEFDRTFVDDWTFKDDPVLREAQCKD